MTAETVQDFEALEAQASHILDLFKQAGFERVAPSIIQPADVFLDEVGESLRGRTYVFTSPGGEELCLRPDLTIPACRVYLERHPEAGSVARYCYNGPAFRYQIGGATEVRPREFRQAGIELFGASDDAKAEAEVLSLVIDVVKSTGTENFKLRLGDLALFFALLESLDIPERWRQRLAHHFWRPKAFNDLLWTLCDKPQKTVPKQIRPLVAELDPDKPDEAEDIVANYLDEHDIPIIGLRTLTEITERLLEASADMREEPLLKETAELIENYLAISGPPKAAGARIADLAGTMDLDMTGALKSYNRRLETFAKVGIDLSTACFSAEFGRDLEYYSGFVFQLELEQLGPNAPLVGGGRYDGLVGRIGGTKDVSAVGAAIHTERLLSAANRVMDEPEQEAWSETL